MTIFLSRLSNTKKRILVIGSALLILLLVYGIVAYKLANLAQLLTVQIADQKALLTEIANATSNNASDSYTEAIVRDCAVAERTEFDALLGRLDSGLSSAELALLDRLFGRCGSFYAERKAIMVSRLEREIEIYKTYVEQLQTLKTAPITNGYRVDIWQELAVAEKKQSEFFMKLVTLQDRIITSLLEGKSPESEEIKEILTEVSETQGMLVASNKQAAEIRATLISK